MRKQNSVHLGTVSEDNERGLEVQLRPGWDQETERRHAAKWAVDRGYVGHRGDHLSLSWDDWDALASIPTSDEPEERERWAFEHEAVALLLGLGREHLHIDAVGHVGGAHLRLRVLVNGQELDLKTSNHRRLMTTLGERVSLSPLASHVAQHARDFGLADAHTRAVQLALVARMKATRAWIEQVPTVSHRLTLSLAPHFEQFDIAQPSEFSAKWVEDNKDRVSLHVYIKGETQPLPLENLDPDAPIVNLDGQRSVMLSPGATAIAKHAREHRRTRRDRVKEGALRTPFALLGDDVDTTGVDFSGYSLEDFSHRVLGFEPARREGTIATYSSGTPWYEKDETGNHRFLLRATAPDGSSVGLAIEHAEEALEIARRADAASTDNQTAIEVHGKQVQPSPELGDQLRALVRLSQAANAPSESNAPPPNDANKSPRLRPVVEEIDQQDAPARTIAWNIETAVPWATLERMLRPGVLLKAHQRTGIAWLWHRYINGQPGALLADDMGLGKTLQLASFIALAKAHPRRSVEPRPTLVVAPVILIPNWAEELKRFFEGATFPGRILELRDEALRGRKDKQGSLDRADIQNHDIVITSYESLARYAPSLLGINWDIVVLDEAHRIKNRGTSWSIAARGLSGLNDPERPRKFEFGICSTGTPVENHVMDLWALYDFLSPGSPFGTYDAFCRDYEGMETAPQALAQRLDVGSLGSSLLRRTKQEVLPNELPGKHYQSIPIEMSDFQQAQERVLTSNRLQQGGFFAVLQALQKLYQHPWLLGEGRRSHTGSADEAIEASPKLAETLRLLRRIREKGEKVLVFTLWTEMQYLLKDVIEAKLGPSNVRIINGDPRNRARALQSIHELSVSDGFDVMVLSPLAAGVGLNIVAANHVIHYGRWWNPAKEDQATDRAYRIGQTRPVTVYYPVLHHRGSPTMGFDVRLDELVTRKRNMARALLEPVDGDDVTEDELFAFGVEEP